MADQRLGAEVMVERDRFDEFLNAGADLALIAPRVDARDIGDDGGEEVVDLVEAGLVFFGDVWRERLVRDTDSLESEDSVLSGW